MSDETPNVTTLPETQSRLSRARKYVRPALITTAVVAGVVVLKRKLNSSVDGKVNVTLETTDDQS